MYVVDYEASPLAAISLDDLKTKPNEFRIYTFRRLSNEFKQKAIVATCILASGNPILDANRSRANTSG